MSVMNVAEELSANTNRNDLAGAIVAGFAVGVVQSLLTALFRDLSLWTAVRSIVLGVAAYFVVGVLLQRWWRNRLVPNWLLTSLFGTIVFVVAWMGPAVINGWYDPYNIDRSFTDYMLREIEAAGSVVFLLHLVTLPITAIFHYARELVAAIQQPSIDFRKTFRIEDDKACSKGRVAAVDPGDVRFP